MSELGTSKIWDLVKETHPSATKRANLDGQEITSINGIYVAQRATEIFGPCGIGWGYDIVEERLDYAGPIYAERTDKDGIKTMEHITDAKNHTVKINFWYILDGVRGEFSHYGHTKYLYRSTKHGFVVDPEAPKKSLTDAIKKCLSLLGFCADIYLGLFDDRDYFEEQSRKERIEDADDKIAEEERQKQEHLSWLGDTLRLMNESKTVPMLKGLYTAAVRKLDVRGDKIGLRRVEELKDKKLKELSSEPT